MRKLMEVLFNGMSHVKRHYLYLSSYPSFLFHKLTLKNTPTPVPFTVPSLKESSQKNFQIDLLFCLTISLVFCVTVLRRTTQLPCHPSHHILTTVYLLPSPSPVKFLGSEPRHDIRSLGFRPSLYVSITKPNPNLNFS